MTDFKEKKRGKNKFFIFIWGIGSLVTAVISIHLIIILLKIFIDNKSLKEPIFWINTENYVLSLNNYLILLVYFLQIIVTSVFSYYLWRTSKKSNEIAEELKNKEEDKERSYLKENALIVFYDLKLGLGDLKKLYEGNGLLTREMNIPRRLYFSNEWIKNVAVLKDNILSTDLAYIYELYGSLLTIKELLEVDAKKELYEEVNSLAQKVFDKTYLEYICEDIQVDDIEAVLNIKYQNLLNKIKRVSDDMSKDRTILYNLVEENMNNGRWRGRYYNTNGEERYVGIFDNDDFIEGVRKEYYEGKSPYLEIEYRNGKRISGKVFNKNGEILSNGFYRDDCFYKGYTRIYSNRNCLEYIGEMEDGKYSGNGKKFYKDNTSKEGVFKDGNLFKVSSSKLKAPSLVTLFEPKSAIV